MIEPFCEMIKKMNADAALLVLQYELVSVRYYYGSLDRHARIKDARIWKKLMSRTAYGVRGAIAI